MADIVEFPRRRIVRIAGEHHGPRCPMGFRFPGVYRRTGFSFLMEAWPKEVADKRYPFIAFTLDQNPEGGVGIVEPTLTPIEHLDPKLDKGWVMVRWHRNEELAYSYLDATNDCGDRFDDDRASIYQTPEGFFTLLHRSARPTCENRLLIFSAYDPNFMPPGRPGGFPPGEYWHHITRATGEVVPGNLYGSDDDFLWPDDEDD